MNKKVGKIGIVGGGQLGRMLAQAAQKLGYKVIILDPTESSPAGQIADLQIIGSFKDKEKVLALAKISDFITFEIESANEEALKEIQNNGVIVHPRAEVLEIIKDKYLQKVFLQKNNIPVADFAVIENEEDCLKIAHIFGYPFLLKARHDAYDGRGNFVVRNEKDIKLGFHKLSKSKLYAEKYIPFIKELAVVCVRGINGQVIVFPVVETIHENNICQMVLFPAQVDQEIILQAKNISQKVLDKLNVVGVIAVEMFLTGEGKILVNEIAPRVHNSGHLTIEAFNMSQFEAHIRALTNLPLLELISKKEAVVMINILGDRTGQAEVTGLADAEALPGVYVHIYGKIETRPDRKMGHITVIDSSLEKAIEKAKLARSKISI